MLSNLFLSLFTTAPETSVACIVVQLNDKIAPADKRTVYSHTLASLLEEKRYGEVVGGGTVKEEPGEILFCDIQIELANENIDPEAIKAIIKHLEACGAPKGSKIIIDETQEEIPFGKMEGMAVYLDAANLHHKHYDTKDIDFIQQELHRLTGAQPNADRYWEDETSTALYFYGPSFETMKDSILHCIDTYALCRKARIVQIA